MSFFEDVAISQREEKLLNGYDFNKILKAKRLVFMPCVNPDGTEISINGFHSAREYYTIVKSVGKNDHIHWNANAAGIDINHNFDAGWEKLKQMELVQGIKTPAPTRFGGSHLKANQKPERSPPFADRLIFRGQWLSTAKGRKFTGSTEKIRHLKAAVWL